MKKVFYQQAIEDVLEETGSQLNGLPQEVVEQKQASFGFNELAGKEKKSSLALFIDTFKDAMVIVLLVVTMIQVVMGAHIEALVIFSVLMLNSIVSVVQAKKAEGSLDALKNLSAPEAKVLRDGQEVTIPAKEIVVGDIVLLEAGDYVPADGRLIEAASLKVDEGMLTGESVPAEKSVVDITRQVPIGDRINSVFSGTIVTYGRAKFVVTGIANETEIGEVANMLESTDEHKTPLQRGLDKFSHKLSLAILGLSLVILAVQIARIFLGNGSGDLVQDIVNAFMFAVAVAVAAIPEALQSIVTIVLSIGTKKMAKKNAIIRQLPAVETLGSASVICTDKTGTLTQNKMTVVDYYLANGQKDELENRPEKWSTDEAKLMQISLLVNDAKVTVEGQKLGDPTEIALIDNGLVKNANVQEIQVAHPRIGELPFDSDRKLMSTLHEINGQHQLMVKGAPDVMFNRSSHVLVNGEVVPMTKERLAMIKKQNESFAKRALRVLAFAYKDLDSQEGITLDDESDLIFVGLLAMIDPPREEVYDAIREAKQAGIKTVMITGDHKTTAVAIAKDIGIFNEGDMALTGTELDLLTNEELANYLEKISVYARVSPENKIRIVRAWQEKGHVSAMTGDGVNDAPALKQADIGIAMGTGTDVAKDAAAMVLTDDNFASIISAVSVGRNVFDNIKKAIAYLFAGNLGAILAIIFALIVGWDSPFTALQLLFINLVNDSLPAIALGMEKAEPTIMKRAPRNPNEGIFSGDTFVSVAYRGGLIALVVIVAQFIGMQTSTQLGVAMAFSTLIWARTLQTFAARSNTETSIQAGFFKNKVVVWAVVICSLLYFVTLLPIMRPIFAIPASFGVVEVGMSLGLALLAVLLMETTKFVLNRKESKQADTYAVVEK
ncbi:cation-translocating P-type ATPase [Vagococcus xieshaowenii]|uniref:P-type Ca(2+) transporter n=1 Tax=Vagococcus xieshaowenii TaxID=2562451 RepID=A0AAJ5EFC8_9ENTE|nr:cation-translocating P-type ATPase [Vagococcus xieshaowenii]QCA29121.1 cation-translocating P-type ATPase [Vagococcus xieshaowenii]TFZ40903.1 cation-translocating P-type ATPase [Vagococcus xieshaowenii]